RHAGAVGDQPSEFGWPPFIGPVQVEVFRERFVELSQGEALDVGIGNVQADIVDAFVEPEVFERREFHAAAKVARRNQVYGSFPSTDENKKRNGPPSERPTGVRVVGNSEAI